MLGICFFMMQFKDDSMGINACMFNSKGIPYFESRTESNGKELLSPLPSPPRFIVCHEINPLIWMNNAESPRDVWEFINFKYSMHF